MDLGIFATFGLPALALAGMALALWANERSARRIDAEDAARREAAARG